MDDDVTKKNIGEWLTSLTVSQLWAIGASAIGLLIAVFTFGTFIGTQRAETSWRDKYDEKANDFKSEVRRASILEEQVKKLNDTKDLEIKKATEKLQSSLARINLGIIGEESDLFDVRKLIAVNHGEIPDNSEGYESGSFWAIPRCNEIWQYERSSLKDLEGRLFTFKPAENQIITFNGRRWLMDMILGDLQGLPTSDIHLWQRSAPGETKSADGPVSTLQFVTVQRSNKGEVRNHLHAFWKKHGPALALLLGAETDAVVSAMSELGDADLLQMILMLEFSRRQIISLRMNNLKYGTQSIQKARDSRTDREILYVRFMGTFSNDKGARYIWDEIIVVPYRDDLYLIRCFSPAPSPERKEAIAALREWISRFKIFNF